MKWTEHPENAFVVSLVDDTGAAVLGQIIKDADGRWQAHDYCANDGQRRHLGLFGSALAAKDAVELSVERMKTQ